MRPRLSTEEWTKGMEFLTEVGELCTPLRQEYIMLSDVLGVSALVDTMNNPPLKNATESCLLGPAFTDDAPEGECSTIVLYIAPSDFTFMADIVNYGGAIIDDEHGIGNAEYLFLEGRVLTTDGKPIDGAVVETWETDENGAFIQKHNAMTRTPCISGLIPNPPGLYDVQYNVRDKPNGRGRLRTNPEGKFAFRGVVPLAYPMPDDVRGFIHPPCIPLCDLCVVN